MLTDDPKKRGILVVDDERGPRESLRAILRARQYANLLFAGNGVEALEQLANAGSTVYLILLDMRMPIMDGMTFLRHLVERADGCPVGIVAMTGFPTAAGRDEFFGTETNCVRPLDYLAKPCEITDIFDGVAKSLDTIHALRTVAPG